MSTDRKRPTRQRIGKRRICGRVFTLHWYTVPSIGAGAEYTGGPETADYAVGELVQPEGLTIDMARHFGIDTPPSPPRRLRYRYLRILNLEIRCES